MSTGGFLMYIYIRFKGIVHPRFLLGLKKNFLE